MKRSKSSQEFAPGRTPRTTRYMGRYSFPKTQSRHKKKLKPRQKNSRLSDYLEEYDESYHDGDSYQHPSTSISSDNHNSQPDSNLPLSPSKSGSGEFERLRYELRAFTDENNSDSIGFNSQEAVNTRAKIANYLWLNLQAFFANRQMSAKVIQHSLEAQERILKKLRDGKCPVLEEIASFRIKPNHDPETSWLCAVYDRDFMGLLHQSLHEVGDLLEKYDSFYSLYPSTQVMIESSAITIDIDNRTNVLYAWYNTLNDVDEKLQQLCSYFELLNDSKRKSSSSLPRLSSSSSTSSSSKLDKMWPRLSSEADTDVDMERTDDNNFRLCDESQNSAANTFFASMYSTIVSRSLRLRGMRVIVRRLDQICLRTVEKTWSYFLRHSYSDVVSKPSQAELFTLFKPENGNRISFSNPLVAEMNLPSFFYLFLFLVKIPLDLLNQWLQMKSEKMNAVELDLLTLNTLIEDSHDCLKTAIETKERFIKIVTTTCPKPDEQLAYLESFDCNLDVVWQNYFYYLRSWAHTIANPTNNTADTEWCEQLVNKLKKEWMLVKKWSPSIIRGECTAAKRFCDIARDLFDSINRFLTERFDLIDQTVLEKGMLEEDYIMVDNEPTINNSTVLVLCRELKCMTRNLRERSLKSLHFLKTLCTDFETCSRYKWNPENLDSVDEFVRQLINAKHVMLAPEKLSDCNFIILCSQTIVNENAYIDSLLNATFSRVSPGHHPNTEHNITTKSGGYVVLIPANLVSSQLRQAAKKAQVYLRVNTRLTLSHLTSNAIYLISESYESLNSCREEFERAIHRRFIQNCLVLVDDFCSCNDQVSEELSQIKEAAFNVGRELWTHAIELNSYILNGRDEGDLNQAEIDSINATLLQAYTGAFEYYKELSKITAMPRRGEFYHEIIQCLVDWADYVVRTLQDIKKSTPTWVLAPLNYFVALPFNNFEVYLDEEDRQSFQNTVHKCLDHLRGIADKKKDNGTKKARYSGSRLSDRVENLKLDEYYNKKKTSVYDRIKQANEAVDARRDHELRVVGKIGTTVETKKKYDFAQIFASRRAPFEWQRLENKVLGRGSFGRAMKQLHVPIENNAGLRAIADEVDILRQLDHPNLIKYYGVEVHTDELMIFMEFCSQGTLAKVCREGLDLACVRRYTHHLLTALNYLHEHNIVHRDVKPANIFLGQKDVLKLGDFGCSFRLQGTNTRMGELVNFVGTTAYCAPELQTCGGLQASGDSQAPTSSGTFVYRGYGRAVDIWSCGATVLEMLTGKKPFYYLEHELQIIFQLGSGIPPKIPPEVQKCDLSYSFLTECFKVNPDERPDAKTMLQHAFANVISSIEQDSQEPGTLGFSQSNSQTVRRRQIYRR